jgi:hypothetical protein
MASLTHWDRLVRYVSAKDGQVRYGEPILDSTDDIDKQITAGAAIKVRVLKGSSALTAVPTDEEDEIQQLLGPLSPVEVPIVRCTGLNYKSHSKSSSESELWAL